MWLYWVISSNSYSKFWPFLHFVTECENTRMHISIIKDGDNVSEHFNNLLKTCSESCLYGCSGKEKKFHCPICPKFKPTWKYKVLKHLQHHFEGKNKFVTTLGEYESFMSGGYI